MYNALSPEKSPSPPPAFQKDHPSRLAQQLHLPCTLSHYERNSDLNAAPSECSYGLKCSYSKDLKNCLQDKRTKKKKKKVNLKCMPRGCIVPKNQGRTVNRSQQSPMIDGYIRGAQGNMTFVRSDYFSVSCKDDMHQPLKSKSTLYI